MMLLQNNEYETAIKNFKNIDHSIPIIYSVIEKNNGGKVFVDNVKNPENIFILPDGGFIYYDTLNSSEDFMLEMKSFLFSELIPAMTEKEMVLFAFDEQTRTCLDKIFSDEGVIRIQRFIFDFSQEKFLNLEVRALPEEFSLTMMKDEELREYNVLKNTGYSHRQMGCRIMKGSTVISQCVSIFIGGGEAEIDIFTHENYRNKGMATICAHSFILECLKKGLKPSWSCWPFRAESIVLAEKLGFMNKKMVDAHFWAENM